MRCEGLGYTGGMAESVYYGSPERGGPPTLFETAQQVGPVLITDQRAVFGGVSYALTDIGLAWLSHFDPPADLGCLIGWFYFWVVRSYSGTDLWIEVGGHDRKVHRCRDLAEGKQIMRAIHMAQAAAGQSGD